MNRGISNACAQTLVLSVVTANSSPGPISWLRIVKVQKRIGSATWAAQISNTPVTPAVSTANSEELDK